MMSLRHQCDILVTMMIYLWRHLCRGIADSFCHAPPFFNNIRNCCVFFFNITFRFSQTSNFNSVVLLKVTLLVFFLKKDFGYFGDHAIWKFNFWGKELKSLSVLLLKVPSFKKEKKNMKFACFTHQVLQKHFSLRNAFICFICYIHRKMNLQGICVFCFVHPLRKWINEERFVCLICYVFRNKVWRTGPSYSKHR